MTLNLPVDSQIDTKSMRNTQKKNTPSKVKKCFKEYYQKGKTTRKGKNNYTYLNLLKDLCIEYVKNSRALQ